MENTPDPSRKNQVFDTHSLEAFFKGYCESLQKALANTDTTALGRVCEIIETAGKNGAHIYAIGNGGSAAIADHLCCDWTKSTDAEGQKPIATHSLSSNVPLYSAIANDFGFDSVFSRQISYFGKPGDVLLAISSSGNSANIIQAVEQARTIGMRVIGLTGFSGGRLKDLSDVCLHVAVANYGVVEDAHQALMHVIAQFITAKRLSGKS